MCLLFLDWCREWFYCLHSFFFILSWMGGPNYTTTTTSSSHAHTPFKCTCSGYLRSSSPAALEGPVLGKQGSGPGWVARLGVHWTATSREPIIWSGSLTPYKSCDRCVINKESNIFSMRALFINWFYNLVHWCLGARGLPVPIWVFMHAWS